MVLVRGAPVVYLERGGRRLRLYTDDEAVLATAVEALRRAPGVLRRRSLRVERVNGVPALMSWAVSGLRKAGFRMEPNALVLDPPDR